MPLFDSLLSIAGGYHKAVEMVASLGMDVARHGLSAVLNQELT